MGCVVKVWWKPEFRPAPNVPWNFCETELVDFQDVCMALEADQLLSLVTLWCRRDSEGDHIVFRREPTAARGSAIARIELPRGRFFDEGA